MAIVIGGLGAAPGADLNEQEANGSVCFVVTPWPEFVGLV